MTQRVTTIDRACGGARCTKSGGARKSVIENSQFSDAVIDPFTNGSDLSVRRPFEEHGSLAIPNQHSYTNQVAWLFFGGGKEHT